MVGTTTTVKIFIDIFIGVWAFILAYIWTRHIEPRQNGDGLRTTEIWERFPKFVLGFVGTFLIVFVIALASEAYQKPLSAAMNEANVFRQIFFLLTFFAIGLMADLRKLWQEGIGRLAAVYVRLHRLGGADYLVDFLPRRAATDCERVAGSREDDMAAEEPNIGKELRQMPAEPLLPVEKKLIGWSLGVGAVLLVILIWATEALFPEAAAAVHSSCGNVG